MSSAEDAVAILKPWLDSVERTAFMPVVEAGLGTPEGSRFNGRPWLVNDEPWPICGVCLKPMAMFLQLDLDALPAPLQGAFGSGLLQLFYCVRTCSDEHEGWNPQDTSTKLVRIIGVYNGRLPSHEYVEMDAEELAIIDWQGCAEYPDCEESGEHGLQAEGRKVGATWEVRFVAADFGLDSGLLEEDDQEAFIESTLSPEGGDKLGGWPAWVQGVEYPSCPICEARMRLVFQIESEDHVPFMLGDVGRGHITQCPEHKQIVAFGWACH